MMAVCCASPSRQIEAIREGDESGGPCARLLVNLIISAFNNPLQSLIDAILDRLRIGVKEEQARRRTLAGSKQTKKLDGYRGKQIAKARVEEQLQSGHAPRSGFAANNRYRGKALKRNEEKDNQPDDGRSGEDWTRAIGECRGAHVFQQPFLLRIFVSGYVKNNRHCAYKDFAGSEG
jgi:hypothetical protein